MYLINSNAANVVSNVRHVQGCDNLGRLLSSIFEDGLSKCRGITTLAEKQCIVYNLFYEQFISQLNDKNFVLSLTSLSSDRFLRACLVEIGMNFLKLAWDERKKKLDHQITEDKQIQPLCDTEKSVLFYIAGYILQRFRKFTCAIPEVLTLVTELLPVWTDNECATPVSANFSDYTKLLDRGGLQKPSDNFFFFICYLEQECTRLISSTSNFETAKECILCNSRVQHLFEKLSNVVNSSAKKYVLEKIVGLYLNIRGYAYVKFLKKENSLKYNKHKSLRNSLQK